MSLVLVTKSANGTVTRTTLGKGRQTVQVERGARYEVVDAKSGKRPEDLEVVRQGDDLVVHVNGKPKLELDGFYNVADPDGMAYLDINGANPGEAFFDAASGREGGLVTLSQESRPIATLGGDHLLFTTTSHGATAFGGLGVLAPLLGAGGAAAGVGVAASGGKAKDKTAPDAPRAALATASDSGKVGDGITNVTKPVISGTAEAGATIKVVMPGTGEVLTTTAAADGSWSVTPTQAIANGTSGNAVVTASDAAGNVSVPVNVPLTIDTAAPAAPVAKLDPASDSAAKGDGLTNDTTPTISGTGTAGDTITVVIGGQTLTTTVAADGTWSVTPAVLADGSYTAVVTATDPAGNVSAPANVPVTIDAAAPAVTVVPQGDAMKTASEATAAGGVITVKSEAGSTSVVTLTGPNGTVAKTIVNDGTAKPVVLTAADLATLGDGPIEVSTVTTDAAGNVTTTPDGADGDFVLDTVAPGVPGAVLAPASGSGIPGDGLTNDTTPTISGTGTAGDTITVVIGGQTLTTTVAANGTWSVTPAALVDGPYTAVVTATDPAGNVSAPATVPVKIDSQVPAAGVLSFANLTDTGTVGDGITEDNTYDLVLTGAEPGASVVYQISTDGGVTWQPTTTGQLAVADGNYSYRAVVTDAAGNAATSNVIAVRVDANDAPLVLIAEPPVPHEGAVGAGTVIATAVATDKDGDPITYSITPGTDPNGYYQVNPLSGAVTLTPAGLAWVQGGNDLPPLNVTADDGRGGLDTALVAIPATLDANDAPVLTVPAVAAPVEGTANTTTPLTTASAVDEDGDPVTYGIAPGTDPNGYYQINPTTGVVTLTQAGADLVNAGGDLPPLSVTATDGQATDTETVVVPATTDANDAPVLTVTPVASLTEGAAAAGTVVATASATDEDGDALTYTLSANPLDDNGDPIYAIDPNTGAVSLTAAGAAIVNAGGDLPAFSVTVSDSKGGSDTEAATPPATTDVNDAPVLTVTPVASLTEGAAALGTVVANASASDEDGDTLTYSLASNPGGYYAINSATGQVSLTEAGAAIVNAGGDLPAFSVTVSDSKGGSDTEVATPPATTDVNDAPVLTVTPVASLTEGAAAAGTVVATSSATDEDGDTLTYSLAAGSDPSGYYAIDPVTGAVSLTAAGAAWVNAGNDLPALSVTVSDGKGGSDTEAATPPATTDVNDAPVLTMTPVTSLTEGAAALGTVVANASATDEDGDTLTYSLASNPGGYYAINSATGQVSLTAAGAAWVNAGNDLPAVQVSVSDSKGGSDTETAALPATTDVNDAPVLTVPAVAAPVEGTANTTTPLTTASAVDEDGDPVTYGIAPGSDPNGYYQINPATGVVTLTQAGADLVNAGGDLPPLSVTATDGQATDTEVVTVPATVDVNDAPVLTVTPVASLTEGAAAAGTVVATSSATDEDGDTLTYSLVAGSDPSGYFAIDPVTGTVSLTAAGAAWVNAGNDLPAVQVSVSDSKGGSDTETAALPATTDVNDAPVLTVTPVASLTEGAAAAGTVVATSSATDEDGDTLTYSLASNPGGYYAINSVTGQVSLTAAGAALVNAGGDLPTFNVTVSDGKGGSDTEAATPPATTDVNDAPVLTVTPIASLTEGTATVGMVIATSAATDEESDTLTFSLVAGSDPSGYFAINPATGTVTLTAAGVALVNAGGDLPQVKVSVTDGTTPVTATANVPATIDVNDAPVLALTTPPQPMQGTAAVGDLVSHISSTDEDGGAPVYSITANSDPLGFYQIQVVGGISKVTLTAAGAAYVNGGGDLPPVSVTVSDGNGGTDTETVNVPTTFDTAAPPVDGNETIAATEGVAFTGVNLLANATDANNDPMTVTVDSKTGTYANLVTVTNGVLSVDTANASLDALAAGETSTVTVNYTVSDGKGGTDTSSATVTITGVNSVTPPVLLDLNHDGVIAYSQITADMNGDGVADLSSWVAAEDGLLFWDKYGDGSLTDTHQFAFAEFGGGTDLAGLALAFDSNHDNVLDAGDENFQSFRVWQDLDQDGQTDEGELMTLAAAGITAISLTGDGVLRTPAAGVTEFGHGSAVLDDGSRMLVVDAQFEYHQYNGLSTSVL